MSIKDAIERSTGMSMNATAVNYMKQDELMAVSFKERDGLGVDIKERDGLGIDIKEHEGLTISFKGHDSLPISSKERNKSVSNVSCKRKIDKKSLNLDLGHIDSNELSPMSR